MRYLAPLAALSVTVTFAAETRGNVLWSELKSKREQLPGFHQEFEVTRTVKTASSSQASKRRVVLDQAQGRWRERSISGSGEYIRIFDGKDLLATEEGSDEFLRTKRKPKEEEPTPSPYAAGDPDWPKAMELERRPCGLPDADHLCVVMDVPLKRWVRNTTPNNVSRMLEGTSRLILDTETGLLIARRTVETIDNQRGPYQSDVTYSLKRMTYGTAPETTTFQLPSSDMKEVKELSRWDAAKIKKQLVGKPASELEVMDIQGKPVTLSGYQGKLVLLDFWTTWCPPCRADAPALDKLYRKYGDKDLMIVGISVSEERAIVEKFLKEHPHSFPIVLTTENDMPRQYQIGVFPTYIVIERDGTVASAAEGDQGFSELRKLLKKAGLEVE